MLHGGGRNLGLHLSPPQTSKGPMAWPPAEGSWASACSWPVGTRGQANVHLPPTCPCLVCGLISGRTEPTGHSWPRGGEVADL